MLKIVVAGISMTGLCFSLRVKFDKIIGKLFYIALGFVLQVLPGTASKFIYPRDLSFLSAILADAVKTMNAHVQRVIIPEQQFHAFLFPAIDVKFLKSRK